jgi:hypothetical protein
MQLRYYGLKMPAMHTQVVRDFDQIKAGSALWDQLNKIHPSAVGKKDARRVGSVLKLNNNPFGIYRQHTSQDPCVFGTAVVVNNPATGLDLVDGSECSHLLSFCLR